MREDRILRSAGRPALAAGAAIFLLALTFLSACTVSTRPPQNVGFERLPSLRALDGIYRNLGEVGAGEKRVLLSKLLWSGRADSSLDHWRITVVEVRAIGDTALRVWARNERDSVVRVSAFVRGIHFDVSQGRIHMRYRARADLPIQEGDGFLGAHTESVDLGLDLRGDGKYRSTSLVAGIACIIPVAFKTNIEVRFRKVGP